MTKNRKPSVARRILAAALSLSLALPPVQHAQAEDTDLFVNAAFTQSTLPNILFVIDNSANWNANNQHWPTPTGQTGTFKQGESELRALYTVLGDLDGNAPQVNLGLLFARSGSPDGGIVRFAMRTMNTVGLSAFRELIGTSSCADGNNSLTGTPNCILKNFSGTGNEQTNTASTDYSGMLFDAYKYFGGYTSPTYAQADQQPPGAINDSTHHGTTRYFGGSAVSYMDAAAYNTAKTDYASSQATTSACAKNYIVFIGNGFPNQDGAGTLLQNVNGGASPLLPAQLAMQNFTTTAGSVTATLGTNTSCLSASACATAAAATFGTDYDTYECSGGTTVGVTTAIGTDTACHTNAQCVAAAAAAGGSTYSTYTCTGGNNVVGSTATVNSTTCESASACATRAPTALPGYTSYVCNQVADPRTATATSNACETQTNCQTVTGPALLPGYTSYVCGAGTSVSSTTGTDSATVCHSNAQCVTAAQTAFPAASGYNTWSCSGGSTTRTPSSVTLADNTCRTCAAAGTAAFGADPSGQTGSFVCSGGQTTGVANVTATDVLTACHDTAACVAAATASYPASSGYTAWNCSDGASTTTTKSFGPTNADSTCRTCTEARDALVSGGTWVVPTGMTLGTPTCTAGTSGGCSGGRLKNQNVSVTTTCSSGKLGQAIAVTGTPACGAGTTKNQTVAPTYTCSTAGTLFSQTMTASSGSCSGAGNAINRTITASTGTCGGSNHMYDIVGTIASCSGSNLVNQTMQGANSCYQNQTITGTKAVVTVTPGSTFTTPASSANRADEWARFLYTTDVSSLPGQQNVATYTIDVFKDAQDANETALLFNMAKYGGGKYFQAQNEDAIIAALRQILIEIQSVNSVFASASLPINATNRSQNENQVFIGMFRPDGGGNPRWYGNLKRYQIAKFGQDFKLADSQTPPLDAVSTTTGFIQPCAVSYWTQDSGPYWFFQNGSAGQCTGAGLSLFSDSPDGPQVEKGAVAEVMRRGNNPATTAGTLAVTMDTTVSPPTATVASGTAATFRNIYTCAGGSITSPPGSCCQAPATCSGATQALKDVELVRFNTTNVSKTMLGNASMTDTERDNIVKYTLGQDIFDVNNNANVTEPRPAIHGDVAHSRPLPVNYGGTTGVVLFYGANDGAFRAVRGSDGKELWAFYASENHSKLKRLTDNAPSILYTGQLNPPADAVAKDYFFDGSAGIFQNADNSKIWLFPTMRRGGRMVYGFDITTPTTPVLKWRAGCSNPDTTDTASCTTGMTSMGQSWSIPSVALIKGYDTDVNNPLIIMGGGYDSCDDTDISPNNATYTTNCSARKGNAVFVINANTGAVVKTFATAGSVPSDVTLVDRDFDGFADHAYVSDTLGNFYRIDFVDPATPTTTRAATDWKINRIGYTSGGGRKFLFAPAVLPSGGKIYVTNTSGDRERPLLSNYPYTTPIANRAYMLIDDLSVTTNILTNVVTGTAVDMDGATMFNATSTDAGCIQGSAESQGKRGWYFDLNNGTGEQGVTSSLIFGGLVFFSSNRAVSTVVGACANDLGEARGYAVNLLTASGAVGTEALCGGTRSGVFIGGGLPPSPVTGVVPVDGVPVTVMIGGIQRTGGASSAIGSQRVKPSISQKRSRIYWYRDGDK